MLHIQLQYIDIVYWFTECEMYLEIDETIKKELRNYYKINDSRLLLKYECVLQYIMKAFNNKLCLPVCVIYTNI